MKNNKMVPTDAPTIDSLSLWIDRSKCNIIDKRLLSETQTYYIETDEYGDIQPNKPIVIQTEDKTITIRISHKELGAREYVIFTIPAKLLQEKYFEGITKYNIEYIYNAFMSMEIVKCDAHTFLNSIVNDIDICKNIYIEEPTTFDKLTKNIETIVKKPLANRFAKQQNKGIELNTRQRATYKKPYAKFYFKEIELQTKSKKFKEIHLQEYNVKNLIRYEATIKNSKIKKTLSEKNIIPAFKTLHELLEIPNEKLNPFITWSLNQYTKSNIMESQEKTELTPTEIVIQTLLKKLIEKEDETSEEIIYEAIQSIKKDDKNTEQKGRQRMKQLFKKISKNLQEKDEEIRRIMRTDKDMKHIYKSLGLEI